MENQNVSRLPRTCVQITDSAQELRDFAHEVFGSSTEANVASELMRAQIVKVELAHREFGCQVSFRGLGTIVLTSCPGECGEYLC